MSTDVETSQPATIRVSGHAAIPTEPDEAFIWIGLQARSDAPGTSYEAVARLSRQLGAILDEMKIAARDRATTGVNVGEDFEHTNEGRKLLGYLASVSTAARLLSPESITRLMARVTSELDAQVTGPRWQVSAENPTWLEAARLAASNARARAQAYAAGVDAELGRLVSLSEPEHGWHGGTKMIRLASSSPGGAPVDPGEQEVTASVEAVFELLLP